MTANTAAGRLERILVKRARRGPMDPVDSAQLVAGRGIVGNADQGRKRQVTILSLEAWQAATTAAGAAVDPAARRANFIVSGIDLRASRGRVLRIGACRFRIAGETKPCERMDEALPGLQSVMRQQEWSGGAFGEVLESGAVHLHDVVQWEPLNGPAFTLTF